ncbi:MAG: hypothetical protein K0Q95_1690 [Bacteroidota bacterium]|jgi:hypothetical protein|nr:hypothetical protein [Bacteroidota bacterium]
MRKHILYKSSFVVAVLFSAACGTDNSNPPVAPVSDTASTLQTSGTDQGFYDIPSPIQQVQLLQQAGASYEQELLNPTENISKYIQTNSKALNLGVYGADLSYAAVFNQPQDVGLYLNSCQRLATELNIKGDFNKEMMLRLEKSGSNKDSLLRIVSDVYRKSNASLKENDQSHISALVVVGSFVEAMYIATQVAEDVKNKDAIYSRISDFRGSLNNLVALLTTAYDNDFSNVLPELKSIKEIYDESEGELTEAQIKKLTKNIKAIRIRITNM